MVATITYIAFKAYKSSLGWILCMSDEGQHETNNSNEERRKKKSSMNLKERTKRMYSYTNKEFDYHNYVMYDLYMHAQGAKAML